MLEITPKGIKHLHELHAQATMFESDVRALDDSRHQLSDKSERRFAAKKFESKWRRINPPLSILWELEQHGPQTREYFHWRREQPLQEGYIRVHDRARERVIDDLIRRGDVIEQ